MLLLPLALASALAAAPDPAPAPTPTPAPLRSDLTLHFNLGFGLPTGFVGLTLEGRLAFVSLEAGGGMGFGGPQAMVHAWGHLFRPESVVGLALGLGYSIGDVQSKGDLGGVAGPDTRYKPAHWLNLIVAPTVHAFEDGTGPVLRIMLGAMFNLAPEQHDQSRTLFIFGLTLGWDWRL